MALYRQEVRDDWASVFLALADELIEAMVLLPIGRVVCAAPTCSAISLAAAREAVRAIMGDVAKGRNPAEERKQAARQSKEKAEAEALTLGVLIDKWEAQHLADKRPSYATEASRALRFAFKKHLPSPAAALTAKVVKATLHAIADA